MRNDVKLGFAIGGVLLAVVIVFALVNSGSSTPEGVAEAPAGTTPVVTESTTPAAAPAAAETQPIVRSETPIVPAVTINTGSTLPPTDAARSGEARGTDPWEQALNTGRLPMMMANTGSTSPVPPAAKTELPAAKATSIAHPDEAKAAHPVANTPAAIDGAPPKAEPVIAPPSRVTLAPKPEPDADGATRSPGLTSGQGLTRGTATTLSQPTSSVLKQVSARTHTIKSGETFSTIATAYYGHIRYAKLVAKANPGVDSSRLKIGQVINLPAFDPTTEARAARAAATPAAVDSRTQYRVQSGDSLHRICVKLYGDPKKVDALYELNRKDIGPNPTKLKLDMVLQLPAPPSVAQR